MKTTLEVQHGDITKMNGDAIVNAGNVSLMGGGVLMGRYTVGAAPPSSRRVKDCAPSRRVPDR